MLPHQTSRNPGISALRLVQRAHGFFPHSYSAPEFKTRE
jgi:hypothetical protein